MRLKREHLPTSETISLRTGFSKSTVSRALKGNPSISQKTREQIIKVAKELGYAPNAAARSLVTRRSGVIGFIVGEMTNPFYPEQIERLLRHLASRGMQLMLFHVPPGHDVSDVLPVALQYQLDGCIIAAVELSSKAEEICASRKLPTVLINRIPADHFTCAVLCNNRAGGEQAAQFLAKSGRKRIAFIAGKAKTSTSRDREFGFVSGLESSGLSLHLRGEGEYTFEGGFRAAMEFLDIPERPDAIFAANDIMALGALDALRQRGVKVPDEIAVVGFDDIRAADWPAYNLTTIAQPVDVLISRAVDLLSQRIADPDLPPETIYVNGQVKIRGSAV